MEKNPRVGQVDDPGSERGLQVIGQGVLSVKVAADRGVDPAAGPGADVRDDPDLRFGAACGHPERLRQLIVVEYLDGGAVDPGGLHPVPGRADSQLQVGAGGVGLEDLPHDLLAQHCAGLGQRRSGRGHGAGLDRQARHPERPGQDHVIALVREQRAGDDAQRGHLGGQRPVQLVPVVSCGHSGGDHPVGEQFRDKALPAQLAEQVLPEPGTGRHLRQQPFRSPARRVTSGMASGNSGRRRDNHGKLARQRSSCA